MNVSILLMSSALIAGGDAGCDGCPPAASVCCDPCGGDGGLFSKFKSRFGGKPLFFGCGGFKSDSDACGGGKPGLLARLKDKLGCDRDAAPCPCATPCDPCGGSGAPVTGCALPAVPGVPAAMSHAGQAQVMPPSSYAPVPAMPQTTSAPQAMPIPVSAHPQAMPLSATPMAPVSVPRPMPEPMPMPMPVPNGGPSGPIPAVGIPPVEAPRI